MEITIHEDSGALCLAGLFTIAEVEPVYRAMLDYIPDRSKLLLDLKGVESCDTTGAQLLLSLRQAAIRAQKPLHFQHVSPSVVECWSRLGLPADLLVTPVS